jgi:hypothetical protein
MCGEQAWNISLRRVKSQNLVTVLTAQLSPDAEEFITFGH